MPNIKKCAVKGCLSGREKNNINTGPLRSLSLFRVRTPTRLKIWKEGLGKDLKLSDFICHLHFKEEDVKMYEKFSVNGEEMVFPVTTVLKKGAIPSIAHQYIPPDIELNTIRMLYPNKPLIPKDSKPKLPETKIKETKFWLELERTEDKEFNGICPEDPLKIDACDSIHNESKEAVNKEIFRLSILKPTMPPLWLYVNKPEGLEFIRMDTTIKKIEKHIRLNKDLTVTVFFPNNEEIQLNTNISSYKNIYNYLEYVDSWPLCVGTEMEECRFSAMCKSVVVGNTSYKRANYSARCNWCGVLRNRLMTQNSRAALNKATAEEKTSRTIKKIGVKKIKKTKMKKKILNRV